MNVQDYITAIPTICHGQPVFRDAQGRPTRIMVYLALDLLGAGETPEQIIEAYPSLTKTAIQAAQHYAADLLKTRQYFPHAA